MKLRENAPPFWILACVQSTPLTELWRSPGEQVGCGTQGLCRLVQVKLHQGPL